MSKIILKKSSVVDKIPLPADLAYGELALNYADSKLFFKKPDNTIGTFSAGGALQNRYSYTATAAQTTFSASYTPPYVDVYLNGLRLSSGVDYTATSGSSIVLTPGAAVNDLVEIVAQVVSTTILVDDTKLPLSGGTLTGGLTVNTTVTAPVYAGVANAAGAAGPVTLQAGTGTGQAGTSGGNGYVYIAGAGATSAWTAFGAAAFRRRGGVYIQAGTAAGDADATFLHGSTIEIRGTAGTTNGTLYGNGSTIALFAGGAKNALTFTNSGGALSLGGATSTNAGSVSLTAGSGTGTSNTGGAINIAAGSSDSGNAGSVTLSGGTTATGVAGSVIINTAGTERVRVDAAGNVSATGTVTAPIFIGPLIGNATTATTLETARLINGVSFNGSTDITVEDATKLPLAGGTMTGAISFAAGQTFPGTQTALISGTSIKTINGTSVLGSGNIEIDVGVTSFNTRTGAVTLSSTDVTTALGFTPVTQTAVDSSISALVDSAPGTLNTLNELAAALGDDPNFATTVSASIAARLPLAGGTMTGAIGFAGAQTWPTFNQSTTGTAAGLLNTTWARVTTSSGYIEFGPANTSFAHIYTDRPSFYFNAQLDVLGNRVLNAGNYNSYALPLSGGSLTGSLTLTANSTSIRQNSTATWSGDAPNGVGKLEYHSNRWYINAGADSTEIVNFRRGATSVATISNTGVYSGSIAGSAATLNSKPSSAFHQRVHFGTEAQNSGFYKIKIVPTNGWMLSFTIRMYQGYQSFDIRVSGYNYSTNYWYAPEASLMDSTATSIDVRFGYDSASNLWVAVPAGLYTGLDILNVVNGYTQFDGNYADQFTIQLQASLTGTVQTTVTAHRPLKYNESSPSAVAITNNSSLNTDTRNTRGVTRLYRRDDNSDYSVQTNWTGTRWLLRGYVGDTFHAECQVSYADTTNLAALATRANGNFYIDNNYGNTVVGVYSASRYQGVFAMGDAYKLPADGTTTGNLYGMAWSHPNAGGTAGNLSSHGLLLLQNGGFMCALSTNIVASGNVTAYSDERLKTNWRDMPESYVSKLAKVKVGIYDRTDGDHKTQVGVSAQSLQTVLPEAIITAKDEMQTLSVSYGNAALASAVELAKDNCELRARIERLESLIHSILNKD